MVKGSEQTLLQRRHTDEHQRNANLSHNEISPHLSEWLSSINQQTTNVGELWRKGHPSALLVGMQTGAATVESSMELPQKLKMKLPYDTVTPLLGIYPKKPKTLIRENISTPMFTAVIYNRQDLEAAQVSISR